MKTLDFRDIIDKAINRIAPAWPLKNFVAVNPYLGFSDTEFAETAQKFADRGHIKMTMPIEFYLEQIAKGNITREDIGAAIKKGEKSYSSTDQFLKEVKNLSKKSKTLKWEGTCVTDIASEVTEKDWNQFLIDRISFWASAHFDDHVGVWEKEKSVGSLYQAWKRESEIDRSTEIMGLLGFRKTIKQLPEDYLQFINGFLTQLKLTNEEEIEEYLHALLLKTIGWSSYISGIDFNNKLYDGNTDNLKEFLAILMAWEHYFFNNSIYSEDIKVLWHKQLHTNKSKNLDLKEIIKAELVLQNALDQACQRTLKTAFKTHTVTSPKSQAKAQMVFCIDVRSEVYRRNLEAIDPDIETIGFAGFFGFPINYVPLGHEQGKNQCPVLIPSSGIVKESCHDHDHAKDTRISKHQIEKTWKKFKSGAVTSFGFVSPLGLSFLPKILATSFNLTRTVEDPKVDGIKNWLNKGRTLDLSMIKLEDKVNMAASALSGMGLKENLAPLVFVTGHGSSSVNNPHASGLDCGACGGHSGEINALTAQQILNDPTVRSALNEKGIHIPPTSVFIACLHDTTTDEISIVNEGLIPESRKKDVDMFKKSFEAASIQTRLERSRRFNIETKKSKEIENMVLNRSIDWSQIRPEWGLAGCNSFIIAPRIRTQGMDLKGKAFLHNYSWKSDEEFKILELIMTAPMVVTSWINLQYYASTTDNAHFGAGNKTLHNITAGIGVIEGSGGDLRIGLPLQSVHNGEKFEHLPQRLNVVIEAPVEAINQILQKHKSIRDLCDHSWITLHHLDSSGKITLTYTGNYQWEATEEINVSLNPNYKPLKLSSYEYN